VQMKTASGADVKNEWSYTATPPNAFMAQTRATSPYRYGRPPTVYYVICQHSLIWLPSDAT